MRNTKYKFGLTLVEMLVAVAIIVILLSIVLTVIARIDTRSKEQLTENTLGILDAALTQFKDFGFKYDEGSDYDKLVFPIDCNGLDFDTFAGQLKDALALRYPPELSNESGMHNIEYSGCEVLYFLLNRIPTSRETLQKIDSSLITNTGDDGKAMTIIVDGRELSLYRVIDAWGKTLNYDYYPDEKNPDPKEARNFPLITSAGPDGKFGNSDDITNR